MSTTASALVLQPLMPHVQEMRVHVKKQPLRFRPVTLAIRFPEERVSEVQGEPLVCLPFFMLRRLRWMTQGSSAIVNGPYILFAEKLMKHDAVLGQGKS